MKPKPDHKETIKTLCKAIKVYEETYQSFQDDPSGEMYKQLEYRRKDLSDVGNICYQLTFADERNPDEIEAISLGMQILQERRKREQLEANKDK